LKAIEELKDHLSQLEVGKVCPQTSTVSEGHKSQPKFPRSIAQLSPLFLVTAKNSRIYDLKAN
jgi:hypothetical protein